MTTRAFASVALCFALAGCPSSTSGTPIPIEDYAAESASFTCGAWFECCTEAERAGLFSSAPMPVTTRAECEAYYAGSIGSAGLGMLVDAVEAGRLGYDAALAGRCFAQIDAMSCDELRMQTIGMTAEGCDRIFTPRVAVGGACTSILECIDGTCNRPSGAAMGTCERLPALGESCTGACVSGAFCDAGTCAARLAEGAACTSSLACQSFRCEGGTCQSSTYSICGSSASM